MWCFSYHSYLCLISDDNNHNTNFVYKIQTILIVQHGRAEQYRNHKTLLICVTISIISIWMLNGYFLQLVMASHHATVLGDLLNIVVEHSLQRPLHGQILKLPINPLSICKRNSFHNIFLWSQEEMVNVRAVVKDRFAK